MGSFRRRSSALSETIEDDEPQTASYDSILHSKLAEDNLSLCRNRQWLFQDKFLTSTNELKKIDAEMNATTTSYIQDSMMSMQQSVHTTGQLKDQLTQLNNLMKSSSISLLKVDS
eukprot:TRINITY_DN22430_c0_g1_i2.p1 TRINITY_DN22430_c0_g1~~TRINITY_DN22430_c0_g1_i2.p1  ORF type:complete len:115 (+),score=27.52 TRINITY_DN22430_c0_g1_i2:262-606(+)